MSFAWTVFKKVTDLRAVYVSASGSDENDGLTYRSPVQTLERGKSLLRDGFPDWLLLRRGDVWWEGLGQWKLSGRSAAEPMVVSTYGTDPARPLLETGGEDGLFTQGGGGAPATINHVAFVGLHFNGAGETGLRFLLPGENILVEDCMVEGYQTNVVFQGFGGRLRNYSLRRCVIVDSNGSTPAHSQGLYAYGVDGLLIEQSLFDNNGKPGDIYSHNIYLANGSTGCVLRGNIISRAGSHGVQMRSGGAAWNNLIVRCPIGLQFGGGDYPEPGGVEFVARGNVVVEGSNIDGENPRGWGILLRNIRSGIMVGNLTAHSAEGSQPVALSIDGENTDENGALDFGVHDVLSERNVIYDWSGIEVSGNVSGIAQVDDNYSISNNTMSPKRFTQPWRSVASYAKSILLVSDFDVFIAAARAQSKARWRPRLTAQAVNRYLRDGFEMAGPAA